MKKLITILVFLVMGCRSSEPTPKTLAFINVVDNIAYHNSDRTRVSVVLRYGSMNEKLLIDVPVLPDVQFRIGEWQSIDLVRNPDSYIYIKAVTQSDPFKKSTGLFGDDW